VEKQGVWGNKGIARTPTSKGKKGRGHLRKGVEGLKVLLRRKRDNRWGGKSKTLTGKGINEKHDSLRNGEVHACRANEGNKKTYPSLLAKEAGGDTGQNGKTGDNVSP